MFGKVRSFIRSGRGGINQNLTFEKAASFIGHRRKWPFITSHACGCGIPTIGTTDDAFDRGSSSDGERGDIEGSSARARG